jgi:hypothetical protein
MHICELAQGQWTTHQASTVRAVLKYPSKDMPPLTVVMQHDKELHDHGHLLPFAMSQIVLYTTLLACKQCSTVRLELMKGVIH